MSLVEIKTCDVCGREHETRGRKLSSARMSQVQVLVGVRPAFDFDVCDDGPCLEALKSSILGTLRNGSIDPIEMQLEKARTEIEALRAELEHGISCGCCNRIPRPE